VDPVDSVTGFQTIMLFRVGLVYLRRSGGWVNSSDFFGAARPHNPHGSSANLPLGDEIRFMGHALLLQSTTAGQTEIPAHVRGMQSRDLRILAERELKCTITE
jgi:hypothetical protein